MTVTVYYWGETMRTLIAATVLLLAGCGNAPAVPTGPSEPQPAPPVATPPPPDLPRYSVTGTMTDTLTGRVLDTFTHGADQLPSRAILMHPGYVTRTAWILGPDPRIDLFPEAGFELAFYRQFARGELDGRGLWPLRVLTVAPAFYLQTRGLSAETVRALEATARAMLPALTGGRLAVTTWETGAEARSPQRGWIVAELVEESVNSCGRAEIGAASGHIWLNITPACGYQGHRVHPPLFAHELGHAVGFWHVRDDAALMTDARNIWLSGVVTARERHHAALAYARQPGNQDVDVDAAPSARMQTAVLVVD